jgi:exosortase/archaeosortase family protein
MVVARRVDQPLSPFLGLRYPLLAASIAALLFGFYSYPYADNSTMALATQRYLSGYARIVGAVLSLFDPHVVVRANRINGWTFSMSIVKTCDAMEVNILLVSALAAFPLPLLRRLVTIVASLVALVAINILRLCVLYSLGVHAPTWFDRVHQTLAPLFVVGCALAIFLVATRRRGLALGKKPAQTNEAPP